TRLFFASSAIIMKLPFSAFRLRYAKTSERNRSEVFALLLICLSLENKDGSAQEHLFPSAFFHTQPIRRLSLFPVPQIQWQLLFHLLGSVRSFPLQRESIPSSNDPYNGRDWRPQIQGITSLKAKSNH